MSTNSGDRSLLGLPADVLMYILDHTALCDLYWPSHACKTMRRLAKRDFRTMVNTNAEDKAKFLLGLAYVLPGHYFCGNCCQLHECLLTAGMIRSTIGAFVRPVMTYNTSTFNWP
ncbi:F-box domain containing [Fusarium agapanthi]|uniref:F-box domain containing n=1 Tax=Fusarium agapanthi TaxID=1803897 RepID=A0A9P5EH17_9HYPO|nr:F-box domain containing [Fusarium agapanthi]